METSSILQWVASARGVQTLDLTNDQGPHQPSVADEQSKNTVLNEGQPSKTLPKPSEPASASMVTQSGINYTTSEILTVRLP